MGFTSSDEYKLTQYNLTLTGCYYTFKGEYSLQKNTSVAGYYNLAANLCYYTDKASYTQNKAPIDHKRIITSVSEAGLTGNLFSLLYTEAKASFTNVVDDL